MKCTKLLIIFISSAWASGVNYSSTGSGSDNDGQLPPDPLTFFGLLFGVAFSGVSFGYCYMRHRYWCARRAQPPTANINVYTPAPIDPAHVHVDIEPLQDVATCT